MKSPLFAAIILLLLIPVFVQQAAYYQENTRLKTETRTAFLSRSSEVTEIKETLNGLPPGRVYAGLATDFGKYPWYRIGSVPLYAVFPQLGIDSFGSAYSGFDLPTDVRLEFNNTRPEQYDLFNIRYVLLLKNWTAPPYYAEIREFDDYALYQVPTTGYFDLVDAPAVFYGNTSGLYSANFRWLSSSLPEQRQHPILEPGDTPENTYGLPVYPFEAVDQDLLASLTRAQPPAGKILSETLRTNEYRASFTAGRECYLMLKTSYAPGWEVTVDGNRTAAVMVAPGYVAANVAPGTHEAVFSYRPPWYRVPLFLFGALVLAVLGCCQLGFFRKRCGKQQTAP